MKRFFDLTFRPFFVLTGIGTALAGLYAFWPRWAVEKIAKISFVQDYTIILQHWGIMVGLMGVSMIVAAYRKDWRKPILIYSGFEKSSMVYLVATNISHPFSQGFWVGAGMDATVVLYTVVYFAVYGLTSFHERTFKLRHCWIARATVLFAAVGKSGCGIGPTNALRCIVAFSKQVNIPSVRIDWINPNASMNSRNYGARAGPICGARTGLAIP